MGETAKRNPWTTGAGVLTIVGALCTFAGSWVAHGVPPAEAWSILGVAFTAGAGLIKAADAKAASQAPPPEGQ